MLYQLSYTHHRPPARPSHRTGSRLVGAQHLRGRLLRLLHHDGILRAAGLDDQTCAWALDALALYATAVALEDGMEGLQNDPAYHEEIHRQFQSLDPERHPNLVALAPAMVAGDADDRFEFGLELLVSGLAARV